MLSAFLLTDETGAHPRMRELQRMVTACRKASGLEDVSLRDMRPKSASDEQQGAQDRLGHYSASTTKRIYRRLATKARPTK